MIDYGKLQKSLEHLQLQFQNLQLAKGRPELTAIDREAIAESVIQRFETCYDTLWKHLKRYLTEEMGLAEVPNSPKPILKLAGQNDLLASPVEQWLRYADARTASAHDYSGEKAGETLAIIEDFIVDAVGLYQTMAGTTWPGSA
jgi:nucleotidyltransferase substrate binding protein (TIGR01987 family)